MKKCNVGGQAVVEGIMMKSPSGIALAVRETDGGIATEFYEEASKAKKGTFLGLPIVRGAVAFVESLSVGMRMLTRSTELCGLEESEEPGRFEKWLDKKFGKKADKILAGLAIALGVLFSVGLFILLPTWISDIIFKHTQVSPIWRSLTAGAIRLLIFIGYILFCASIKDVRRVFMYHGAEHKTIACYEAEEPLTPENAMKHSRLHPRCGTNYLFLVMAVSILFFALVGWSENKLILFGTRIVLLPLVAGFSYEVLRLAAKSDNLLCRIIRAPGMGLQYITTKEPTPDMIEVAIAALDIALDPEAYRLKKAEAAAEEAAPEEPALAPATGE